MIKAKGDRKVENWKHDSSGLTTDIYLRGTKFVATLLEREYSAPDVAILRRALLRQHCATVLKPDDICRYTRRKFLDNVTVQP